MISETSASPLAQVKVVVDGATGYVGQHLAMTLRQAGFNVFCLVRTEAKSADIDFLKGLGVTVQTANLTDPSFDGALTEVFSGADLAVHLIGSIAPRRCESFAHLHTESARTWALRCQKSGVKRAIMVTALGADKNSKSNYLMTKALAEEAATSILGDKLTVLRPSLIVGKVGGTRDSKLVRRYLEILSSKPFVPLVGGGKNLVQPVYVNDLAKAITAIFVRGNISGVQEIGGPEQVTMRQFVERLGAVRGLKKPFVEVPSMLAGGIAMLSEKLSDVPTLSRDQALLATMDNVTSNNKLSELLGQNPTTLDAALATYA